MSNYSPEAQSAVTTKFNVFFGQFGKYKRQLSGQKWDESNDSWLWGLICETPASKREVELSWGCFIDAFNHTKIINMCVFLHRCNTISISCLNVSTWTYVALNIRDVEQLKFNRMFSDTNGPSKLYISHYGSIIVNIPVGSGCRSPVN